MAESGVEVQMNFAQAIRNATAVIQATPKQMEVASERAIRKTIRWLSGRVARELSQQLGIPQKNLKPRLVVRSVGKGMDKAHILWMGVATMSADLAGKARQTRKGVTVGKRKFEGAFLRSVYNPEENVWIRARRNREQGYMTLSRTRKANHRSPSPELAGRFPIQRIGVEIESVATEAFRRLDRRALDRFKTLIEQELNYAVNHESKKARK
ncbi:hypothetical protein AB6C63_023270 (plasmid) [Vibrio cyclitrophicus]|jgi:mRNA-degrading endonuclease RelE of RelBE toxin-antitoxin system|uniref:hypothetical protein n=1 Tax=uncultured Paraglaciecola sp. TaxID=1765024 RepID=UPI00260395F0|nr:hypothetical protein [uncultured Paraglaciecola sp.]